MPARNEIQNIDIKYIQYAQIIASQKSGFTDGCRVLFLIQRHKDGGHTNNSKLRAYISKNSEEWIMCLAKLVEEKDQHPNLQLRIYQTLNDRNIEKGIMHFKHAQLDADYYDTESRQWFYLDIKNRLVSSLMREQCRNTSYFLYDCDTKDQRANLDFQEELLKHAEIVLRYETKQGVHYITKPFNPNLIHLPSWVEYKRDAMMLLDF